MASFFILLLIAVLIWLFAESRTSRIVGFSIVGLIAVLIGIYLIWRETGGNISDQAPQATTQPAPVPEATPAEQSDLRPSDITLSGIKLDSGVETYSGIDGKQYERPNLRSWTLSGSVKNLSTDHGVRDVTLNVRLYSCPPYYTTPINEVKSEELSLICSKIGERSVGLYDLNLPPDQEKQFSQPLTFPNQGNALNWRFWVDVARVVAKPT
jgi:hypothetical protein